MFDTFVQTEFYFVFFQTQFNVITNQANKLIFFLFKKYSKYQLMFFLCVSHKLMNKICKNTLVKTFDF